MMGNGKDVIFRSFVRRSKGASSSRMASHHHNTDQGIHPVKHAPSGFHEKGGQVLTQWHLQFSLRPHLL